MVEIHRPGLAHGLFRIPAGARRDSGRTKGRDHGTISRMCFSMTADLVAGTALVPVAAASLAQVRHRRELMFALMPALFSAHQLLEVAVWAGLEGDAARVSPGVAEAAMRAYLFIAWPLLPTYMPLAVLLIDERRRAVIRPFLALGLIVSAYLGFVVLANPVQVIRHDHGLEYLTVVSHPLLWAVLYIVAVIAPLLISSYRSIVAFGVLNLVALILVAVFYMKSFASLWCFFAAGGSVLILVHMIRRRSTTDTEDLTGPPVPVAT